MGQPHTEAVPPPRVGLRDYSQVSPYRGGPGAARGVKELRRGSPWDPINPQLDHLGCRLFDNESDARGEFG
jgi:hypothetical protein